jgi:AraC family transcriptional regulator
MESHFWLIHVWSFFLSFFFNTSSNINVEDIDRSRSMQFKTTGFVQIFRFIYNVLCAPDSPDSPWCFSRKVHMASKHRANVSQSAESGQARPSPASRIILPGIDVVREGRAEPFLGARPTLSSAPLQWRGIALENYTVPAVLIRRHEHPEHFLHLVLRGAVEYEISTRGRKFQFTSRPGTIFLLPRGTVDEVNWRGPTERMAVALHPRLLTSALDETAHQSDVELTEHWDLIDRHISALLLEMTADLDDGSPAGVMYGESLANALAVYLLKRYAVRRVKPRVFKGGLPGHRLKRVLDYIADSLDEKISLSQLAAIAGMSPHYFSGLFKQSTGHAPHQYVLLQRIERAKQHLRDPKQSIVDAGLDAGFQNPSHFARMFRKLEGTTPSKYRADYVPKATS